MNSEIQIRRASEGDCAGITALFVELDAFHRAARPDQFRLVDGAARDPVFLKSVIRGPDRVVFVADRNGALLGFSIVYARLIPAMGVRPARHYADIDSFGLTEKTRRLGIGRRLLQASEAWAREKGLPKLELNVWAFNVSAIAFYEAGGFHPMTVRMERMLE